MTTIDDLTATLRGPRIYDLAHPLDPGMPVSPNHPGYRMALVRRHGDMIRPNGDSAANEMIVMGGHTGTHIDGLAHVSRAGRLYGGVDAAEAQTGGRFSRVGMEEVAPIVVPGVLLDVAGYRGIQHLPAGEAISGDELAEVAAEQGTPPPRGGAILVRSGWARLWSQPSRYLGYESGVPGPDTSGGHWIALQEPRVAAHDSMAFEQIPPGAGHRLLPVHGELLAEHGIHIIENVDLEELAAAHVHVFTFICLPLPLVGATGSPVRPIAVAAR